MRSYHWRIGIALLALFASSVTWLLLAPSGLAALLTTLARLRGGAIEYRVLDGRLLDGGSIEGLVYRDAHFDLALDTLAARWSWRPFTLHVAELEVRAPVITIRPRGGEPRLARPLLAIVIDHAVIEQPRLRRGAEDRPLPDHLEGALRLTAAGIEIPELRMTLQPPVVPAQVGPVRIEGKATIAVGAPIAFEVSARATATATSLGEVTATLSGDGRWPRLSVRALTLRGDGGEADLTGAIDLSPLPDLDLTGRWRDLNVMFGALRLPSTGTVALRGPWAELRAEGELRLSDSPLGEVVLRFSGERHGQGFILSSGTGQIAPRGVFELHAEYAPEAPRLALDLDWQDLVIAAGPVGEARSADGSLRVAGGPGAYRIWLRGALDGARLAPMTIVAEGQGEAGGITFERFEVATLGGTVQGALRYAAAAAPTLDYTLSGTNLDPGQRWPALPGALAFTASGRLARIGERLQISVAELRADGRLRGYPLSGHLRDFGYGASGWSVPEFQVQSANTRLEGMARFDELMSVDIRLRSPNLGELLPEAAGDLAFDAALTGSPGEQALRITANGHGLRLAEARAANLVIDAALELRDDGPVAATMRLDQVRWLGQRLARATLDLDGIGAAHEVRLAGIGIGRELRAHLDGSLSKVGWAGTLDALTFTDEVFDHWQLVAPVALGATRDAQRMENLCLRGNPGELCAWARREGRAWQGGIRGAGLPLARLPLPAAYGMTLAGTLGFDFDGAGSAAALERGSFTATLEQAEISAAVLEPIAQHVALEGGNLTISYGAGTLLGEASVYAPAIASRSLNARLRIDDLDWRQLRSASARLSGQLSFDLNELSPLAVFVPQIARPQGSVEANLAVAGTLAQPLFDGWAELRDAAFELPRFGTRIEDLRLSLTGDPLRQLQLTGAMRSGTGQAELNGEVRPLGEHGPALDLRITGAAFTVTNTPAARIAVTPDVRVIADRRGANWTGTLRIPSAELQPTQMRTEDSISRDVVIVTDDASLGRATNRWPVTATLLVDLGPAVTATGPLFETKLTGLLRIRRDVAGATTANGRILISGDVLAYGARLGITNGRISFSGGPLAEPMLDLRAQRELDTLTVGLLVSGVASAPDISLYSTPALPQDRILSYLVMGKPLNDLTAGEGSTLIGTAASLGLSNKDLLTGRIARAFRLDQLSIESGATLGDTSLVIGKYLTPKLYLSYGIGLFEPVGTTRLRYEVNRRWSIQAEQSEEMGVDIFYRIER